VERDPAMALAVGIPRALMGAAEAELRLPRIAKRPAAIVGLEIDKHFWFVGSVLNGHDRARHSRIHRCRMVRQLGTVDIPAEGDIGTPAAGRTPKRNGSDGWETPPRAPPHRPVLKSHPHDASEQRRASGDMTDAVWYFYDEVAL